MVKWAASAPANSQLRSNPLVASGSVAVKPRMLPSPPTSDPTGSFSATAPVVDAGVSMTGGRLAPTRRTV